ncbi:MAG: glycosyltransferase family 2 protein [Chloroflexi bacterium]|nr:glycosyltransferase family 2 protein [Chloroflexota bacterium]
MPQVSVVIVTWNSGSVLMQCLDRLAQQTFKDFEVVLVDNGSKDKSLLGLEEKYPTLNLRVECLESNRGFAAANNLGARLARGQWLALLNSDAFPEPDWLEKLLQAAESNPEFSFFASRQLQANAPHLLDGAGDALHISGLAWRRCADFPAAQFGLEPEEVFSPCAAAALYSRRAFLQVGGFDEDFFSYHEDVDLGFRLRLQGFRCLYVPDAVVHHIGSATLGVKSDFERYHWQRNFIWSFVQNMPSALLWEALPAHLMANFIFQLHFTLRGRGGVLLKAKMDAMRGLSRALRKRREIQKTRKVSSMELLRIMERGPLQPYLLGYHIRKIRQTMPSSK